MSEYIRSSFIKEILALARFIKKTLNFCHIFSEFISHRSLLYPILLSEGVYSTLFVLYANKCSKRDEIYRQRIQLSEKKTNAELAKILKLSRFVPKANCHYLFVWIFFCRSIQPINCSTYFFRSIYLLLINALDQAIITLQQVKEKFCPREMLIEIEKTFKHVETAAEMVSKSSLSKSTGTNTENGTENECITDSDPPDADTEVVQLNADNMMPLTIFLLLRAAIPHLGTEILLLEDLMGPDFEFVMNGFAGK